MAKKRIHKPAAKSAKRELLITRVFDAPRNVVWKAWTEPEQVMRWWGPAGFTSPVSKIDLRVGGKYLACMRSPEGRDFWSTGVYREIKPMQRLVMTDSFADKDGNVVPASYYGMGGDWADELLMRVSFEDAGSKTKMILRHTGLPAGTIDEAREGWKGSFDKLAESLLHKDDRTVFIAEPGRQYIIISRVYDAPQDLVFKTFLDPKLLPEWWGPKILKTTVEKMDVRTGGTWRIVQRDPNNNIYGLHGVYHEITPPERAIQTFEFEGAPGHVQLETTVFEEHDGKTTVTSKSVFQSVEDRDAALKEGMKEGAIESMERFADLLATLDIKRKAA